MLIVQGASEQDEPGTSLADAVALARRLEQAGLRKKEAARQAAEQTGLAKNAIYAGLLAEAPEP